MMTNETCGGSVSPVPNYNGYITPVHSTAGIVGGKPESDGAMAKLLLLGVGVLALYYLFHKRKRA
jgi:hypothetical protein